MSHTLSCPSSSLPKGYGVLNSSPFLRSPNSPIPFQAIFFRGPLEGDGGSVNRLHSLGIGCAGILFPTQILTMMMINGAMASCHPPQHSLCFSAMHACKRQKNTHKKKGPAIAIQKWPELPHLNEGVAYMATIYRHTGPGVPKF